MANDSPSGDPPKTDVLSYEELEGGIGREVFFRPQRFRSAELGSVKPLVEILVGETTHACALYDVSQTGVAFAWPDGIPAEVGTALTRLAINFDEHEAYRGSAIVGSVREVDGAVIVGASFVDSLMNVDDVLHLREVMNWHADTGALTAAARPWYCPGFDGFKSLVSELRLFFDDTAARLGELEARLPWHVVHGDGDTAARAALLRKLQSDFVPEYLRYSEGLDAALRGATKAEWLRLKEYSVRHVHAHLMTAPFVARARLKPLGYPGDFEVMRFLYERQFEGPTLFAKALHHAVIHMRAGEAVRTRKDMLKARLRSLIETPGHHHPVRIASIAAGPGREVVEVLGELTACPNPVEIVLFDQDRAALATAQGGLRRSLGRWPGVRVVYLHDSIKRLLHDATLFQGLGPFDMIFCAGLFDYLQFNTAVNLCRNFYANLAAGGRAYVGNMVDNPCRWFMEHHCDWFLTYRTRDEILEFGRVAAPAARVELIEEPTGVNPFLVMFKPP